MKKIVAPPRTAEQSVDALVKTIRIPPRPSLLAEVQEILACSDPDPQVLAKVIAKDVALSASLLKLTNSAFFGLRLKARSVEHAVNLLGLNQCGVILTGFIARQSIQVEGVSLEKFWDVSGKRAQAMVHLSRQLRVCHTDAAHTFGLFCDIGIPLLLERFPDYPATLECAQQSYNEPFTEVEERAHMTSHASIGALMARTWGLPESISLAILLHHDYSVLQDRSTDEPVPTLIALALLAEYAIQKYQGQDDCAEWAKGGRLACAFLGLSEHDLDDRFEELQELFNQIQ